MKKDAWYIEHKRNEKRKRERIKKIRAEIFSGKAKKLASDIFQISNGDVFRVKQTFGTKYENSAIIRIEPEEVDRHIKEAGTIKELAKIMARK